MGNIPDFCRNASLKTNETSYKLLSECWNEKWIAEALRKTLPLIILPVSLISNCLSFLALRSHHMRGTSTAFFMLALSVLDPLVLLTKNLVYFSTFAAAHAASCKILYFLIYVFTYTNVWILVIMTVDKFFAVWFPLKVSNFCTVTRAKYVCIFLPAITSIICVHHFWTIDSFKHPKDPRQRFCYYDGTRYGSIQRIWRYADFVIWCSLPFILLLTLSILIIYKLHQNRQGAHQNIRQIMDKQLQKSQVSNGMPLNKQQQQQYQKKKLENQVIEIRSNQNTDVIRSRHRHITLMLLAVAVVFLLLTLPNSIYFVLDLTYGFNKLPIENNYYQWLRFRRLTILTVVMFQLSDLQHATNFFLYLLTSDKFRRSVVRICVLIIPTLPSLAPCCFQDKARASTVSAKIHYSTPRVGKGSLPYCISVSDRSSLQINTSRISNRQTQQPFYKYSALLSKQTETTSEST
ncbi:unnamed protein product [Rotaria magnacalcarata]|uniref:G-protein coupled receptors family 1 profile domain-containing protein n=1 Tax=Rotaria magnacalcarata TaxID=392030 RepID=A0A816LB19_9BILA|nr:unnamed protein product [Rotaria magnacalcarata]CAF2251912.1 unnamed protein product [Rotaria magnacalcarata]CAF3912806.1 unnamed protein product [Rotaria magnacalcarata]CAF4143822.1 unnamed protein product [Rotaria magnacalcarata]